MVITIDGHSGSGKSTIAKLAAARLNFALLNTGLLYRKVTKTCLDSGVYISNTKGVIEIARNMLLSDNMEDLHSEVVSKSVALVAMIPEVREEIRKYQKHIAEADNIIVEGRDVGTVVFPNAEMKIFITATLRERAERRYEQIKYKEKTSVEEIMANLKERDYRDEHRETSPLLIPFDSYVLDTTGKTIEESLQELIKEIKRRCPTTSSS